MQKRPVKGMPVEEKGFSSKIKDGKNILAKIISGNGSSNLFGMAKKRGKK